MNQNQLPLISIITPAYNASRFIADTIRSVQAQSYANWEMLIVDDCSTDHTKSIVREHSSQDSRIRILELAKNSGPAEARNMAVHQSAGEFLAFLDSDDCWLPGKLENQLQFMQTHQYDFTFTAYRRIRTSSGPAGKLIPVPKKIKYNQLLGNTAIATSTVMLRKGPVSPVRLVSGFAYDDFILWLDILKRGHTAYGLNIDLMRYRLVDNSISHNKLKSAQWVWRIYREHENLNVAKSFFCFAKYGLRGYFKHRTF